MRYIIDFPDDKVKRVESFFKSNTFIRIAEKIDSNVITNPLILESIEKYESQKVIPKPYSIKQLKKAINV